MNKKTAEELKTRVRRIATEALSRCREDEAQTPVLDAESKALEAIDDLVLQNDPMGRIEKLLGGLTGVDEMTEEDRSRILEAFQTAFVENRRVPKPG